MELTYYGGNCLRIKTKKTDIVVDDNLAALGLSSITKKDDVAIFTSSSQLDSKNIARLTINQAGEYEIGDVSITGILTAPFKQSGDEFPINTIFKIENQEVKLIVLGNSNPDLTGQQIEALGIVNILVIPVGNNEVTLSGTDALKVVKDLEPSLIVPTHYADKSLKYPHEQSSLDEAVKQLSMEVSDTQSKLKLKSSDFTDITTTKLVIVSRA